MKKILIAVFFICNLFVLSNLVYAGTQARVWPSPGPHIGPPISDCYDYRNYNKNNYWRDFYPQRTVRPLEKGWHTDSIGKFYCRGDGNVFRNGWFWIDGNNYKFDNNGYVYRNQWIKDCNGAWYFVDCDGAAVTGWRKIDNVWYYFNPEIGNLYGVMSRNTVMYINDYTFGSGYFAFNNEGAILTNTWYHGHYYGSNGVRVY